MKIIVKKALIARSVEDFWGCQLFDVCIVGGGIIGATTAISCAREGLEVCVIERDTVLLRGSTLAGFGALTPYSDPYFVGEPALFAEKSLKLYQREWLGFLNRRTDINVPLSKSGLIQVAENIEYLDRNRSRYENNCIDGYRPQYLSEKELRDIEPALTIDAVGGIYHPEPWIDLQLYMAAIEQCVQTFPSISIMPAKRVLRVTEQEDQVTVGLDSGDMVVAKKVVLATGLSHEPIEGIGTFPISWVRGDGISVRTKDNRPIFKNNIYCTPGFISPRNTGEMLLGSTYINEGVGDSIKLARDRERVTFGAMADIAASARRISTQLDDCNVERQWHGWRPCSEDEYPILGTIPGQENTIYALGFLGLGITMSVAVGDAITTYAKSGRQIFPSSMSPERFKI